MANKLTKEQVVKISKISLNVLFYVVIVMILMFAIANMRVKTTADVPNLFGGGFLSVQSDSMDGSQDNSFKKGDLIFVRMLNDKRREKLEVGDIVTFYGSVYDAAMNKRIMFLNTHRIVEITETIDGEKVLITQGDKVAEMPGRKYGEGGENDDHNYESLFVTDAIAVYRSKWSGTGKTLDYLQSPTGFGLFIVLPAVIILIVEAYFLIRNVLRLNKEKMEKEFQEKDEEMRKQILEELKKEQEANKEEENSEEEKSEE